MKKNILQFVSGSFESAYLLIKNINEGHDVYPFFIRSSSENQIKQTIEFNAVKQLLEKFNSFNNLKNLTVKEINLGYIPNIFSTQPISLMLSVFNEVISTCDCFDYDEVHFDYIIGDDAVSYQNEIKNLWKTLFSFSLPEYKIPKIVFPLMKYNIDTIMSRLDELYSEIIDICWFCETPNIINSKRLKNNNIEMIVESCGKCRHCTQIKEIIIKDDYVELKKHKAVILVNDIYNYLNKTMKKLVRDINSHNIPYQYITVDKIDEKTAMKLNQNHQKKDCSLFVMKQP